MKQVATLILLLSLSYQAFSQHEVSVKDLEKVESNIAQLRAMRNELTSLIASKSRKYKDAVAAVSRAEKHTRDSIINAVSSTDEVRQLNSEIADIESRKKDRKQALAQELSPLESKISDLKSQRQKIIDELYRLKDA